MVLDLTIVDISSLCADLKTRKKPELLKCAQELVTHLAHMKLEYDHLVKEYSELLTYKNELNQRPRESI